jgi:uncharacterized membrane protein (UPF0127 family)
VIPRARQVHTFGMRYPLDVIFCDGTWVVVHVVRDMPPGRITKWVRRARYAVELPSAVRSTRVGVGDRLRIERY